MSLTGCEQEADGLSAVPKGRQNTSPALHLALLGRRRAGGDAEGSGRSTCLLSTSQQGASAQRRFDKAGSRALL